MTPSSKPIGIAERLRAFAEAARAIGVSTANIHPDRLAPHVAESLLDLAIKLGGRWRPYSGEPDMGWFDFVVDGFVFALHGQPNPASQAA